MHPPLKKICTYPSRLSKRTMHSLWLSTFLSLLIFFTSVSLSFNSMAHDGGGTNDTSGCNSVPYPFGAPGDALKGFEVICTSFASTSSNRTTDLPSHNLTQDKPLNPSLKLPTGAYLIQNISLQGQVRILTGPIYQQCDDNETGIPTSGTGWLNLTGTPFTLSNNYTTFIAIGCDDVVLLESVDGNGNRSPEKSGCVAFCSNSSSRIDGSCSGLGCCQMPLPGPQGLKSFELNLYKVQNTRVNELDNCSAGFFATRDEFPFRTANFDNKEYFKADGANYVVVLDWVIEEKSCKEAEKDSSSFACKKNSQCYDSLNGVGYLCNCSQGYEGNPYVEGGCEDVNECQHPELNPCVRHCINTEGSVTCACPSGMTGDGRIGGSGCKKAFPLNLTLGICLGLVFIMAMASFYTYSRLQRRKLVKMRSEFFRQNGGWMLQQRLASQGIDSTTRIFTAKELQRATDNYSQNRILGQGGYGTVYKGVLSNQQVVAIKRSKLLDEFQVEQFVNEITILSQTNHRNIVRLLGCCLETQVPLLVYEFISNGTLFEHIHNQNIFQWEDRLRISRETAHAIAYLHSATSFPIIHRDIKSSNILLDDKYTAKVSDFGASRSVPFDQTHITTLVQGTLGYLDPEYFYTSQLTEKSDVYSFGVVLAELLTGEKPICFARSEEFPNLAMYFTVAFDEKRLLQVIDPSVASEAGAEELYIIAQLTRRCLNMKGEERPEMKEVALELESIRRMSNQQNQRRKEVQQMLVEGEVSNAETEECTSQYNLEIRMLSSMDKTR